MLTAENDAVAHRTRGKDKVDVEVFVFRESTRSPTSTHMARSSRQSRWWTVTSVTAFVTGREARPESTNGVLSTVVVCRQPQVVRASLHTASTNRFYVNISKLFEFFIARQASTSTCKGASRFKPRVGFKLLSVYLLVRADVVICSRRSSKALFWVIDCDIMTWLPHVGFLRLARTTLI